MTESFVLNIQTIFSKLNPSTIHKFLNWAKIVQIEVDGISYFVDFRNFDKENVLVEGNNENANFALKSSSENFIRLINGSLDPVEAVVQGLVNIDGNLTDALEFSEILNDSKDDIFQN